MKLMKVLLMVVLVAAVLGGRRRRFRKRRRGNREVGNHEVCRNILGSWWDIRENDIARALVTQWDNVCINFSADRNACITRSVDARANYLNGGVGTQSTTVTITSSDATKVSCAMLGAHSDRCVANPCAHLNNGACNLQDTGGLCVWWTKAQAKKYKKQGVQYGCHRNPCHIGGEGRTADKDCEDRSINGLIQCTYCSVVRDSWLKGKGMGCQATILTTESSCAPVNSGIPAQDTVYQSVSNGGCQCSSESPICSVQVSARDGEYQLKYGSGRLLREEGGAQVEEIEETQRDLVQEEEDARPTVVGSEESD